MILNFCTSHKQKFPTLDSGLTRRLSVAMIFDRQRTSATKHPEEVERAVSQRSTARAVDTPRVLLGPASSVERAFPIATQILEHGLAQLASTRSFRGAGRTS
jgi:hypothetical protein